MIIAYLFKNGKINIERIWLKILKIQKEWVKMDNTLNTNGDTKKLLQKRLFFLGLLLILAMAFYIYSIKAEKLNIIETESKNESIEITIKIPKIKNISNADFADKFNAAVEEKVKLFVEDIKKIAQEDKEGGVQRVPYIAHVNTEVRYQDNYLSSFVIYYYQFTGGAHGITTFDTYNIDLIKGSLINLADILNEKADDVIKREFISFIKSRKSDFFPDSIDYILKDDIFKRAFTIEPTCLRFFYNQYEIAPYSSGIPEFCISWEKLKPYIVDEGIKKFISNVENKQKN